MPQSRKPNLWGVVAITYGLVIGTTLLAVAAYYYFRSEVPRDASADPNPMRTMMVGAVWVPIYPPATYIEPGMTQQKEITTGVVKFRTKDPAGTVLAFYKDSLDHTGYYTSMIGNAGGTIHGVRSGGKISVNVTVTSSSENTAGEIHTIHHADPARDVK